MAETDLTGIGNGTRDTESLKAFTDGGGRLGCLAAVLLDRDRCAYGVSPACIFKTDRLDALDLVIDIETGILGDLLCFLDGSDSITVQNGVDLIDTYFI